MSDVTLGKLVEGNPGRDAIHLAVVPMVAGEWLKRGFRVRIEDGKAFAGVEGSIGIVDPFLIADVREGQTFWLCLYPKTITSLRHVWEHPQLPLSESQPKSENVDQVSASKRWLECYVRTHCPYWNYRPDGGYLEFLLYVKRDRWIYYKGSDCHGLGDVEDAAELFSHLSVVLERRIDADYFVAFTCSC